MYCLHSSPTKKCEIDGQYLNVDYVKFYSKYYTYKNIKQSQDKCRIVWDSLLACERSSAKEIPKKNLDLYTTLLGVEP